MTEVAHSATWSHVQVDTPLGATLTIGRTARSSVSSIVRTRYVKPEAWALKEILDIMRSDVPKPSNGGLSVVDLSTPQL